MYDQNFYWRGGGGGGDNSERFLKLDDGGRSGGH